MSKTFCFFLVIVFSTVGYAQVKKEANSTVGISIPLIWNNSNGIYYGTGNLRKPEGEAISYGLNLNFSKPLHNNWFFQIGAGYFKQKFNIIRPFDFDGDTVTNLGYSTKGYEYDCFQTIAGIGYKYKIKPSFSINALVTYNLLKSFKQKYTPTSLGLNRYPTQANRKNMEIGYFLKCSFGAEKMITKKIGVGVDVLIPIVTKWKNDQIFWKSLFGDDSQIIAENKFSVGTAISCKYHF